MRLKAASSSASAAFTSTYVVAARSFAWAAFTCSSANCIPMAGSASAVATCALSVVFTWAPSLGLGPSASVVVDCSLSAATVALTNSLATRPPASGLASTCFTCSSSANTLYARTSALG